MYNFARQMLARMVHSAKGISLEEYFEVNNRVSARFSANVIFRLEITFYRARCRSSLNVPISWHWIIAAYTFLLATERISIVRALALLAGRTVYTAINSFNSNRLLYAFSRHGERSAIE